MSRAQASLVVNLASSIVTVLDTAAKLYSDVKDASYIPNAFVESVRLLPVIRDALQTIQTHMSTSDVDEEACRRMQPTLERCIGKALQLETVLRRVVPRASTSRRDRYLLLANASGKDSHIETLMQEILEDVTLLAENPAVRSYTGTEVEKLTEAIRGLPARRPSMRDDAPKTPIINYSSSTINVNSSSGTQNNNTNSGRQYVGQNLCFGGDPPKDLDPAKVLEEEHKRCLRSLIFATIDARRQDIATAHQDTCEWIFKTSQFRQWRDRSDLQSHSGMLWIKGKPGAGKSTLMKHIWQHCSEHFEGFVAAAYFFNARGGELEKTSLGMLRSITCQLIKQHDLLYERFLPRFRDKVERHETWEWRESELKDFLLSQAKTPQLKPLFIHIDALDECREFDVRDVVRFLEDMSMCALSANVTLHICLSSRHYPTISIRRHLDLVVEENNNHDIVRYVHNKLLGQNKHVETEVLHKAEGVFMWVVLVVAMLNRAYDEGKIVAVQQKLNELPGDLENMFETLLNEDNPDKHETICLLLLVMFARRPLNYEELYFAVITRGVSSSAKPRYQLQKNTGHIEQCIYTMSKGLVDIRPDGTIRSFHVTLHYYIQSRWLQKLSSSRTADLIGIGNGYLRAFCMSYITMSGSLSEAKPNAEEHTSKYPFLEYASTYVLDHAEEAQRRGISQHGFVRFLRQRQNFTRLHRFRSIADWQHFWGCDQSSTLFYLLISHGYYELARIDLLEKESKANASCSNALEAAYLKGQEIFMAVLVEKGGHVSNRILDFLGQLGKRASMSTSLLFALCVSVCLYWWYMNAGNYNRVTEENVINST